MRELSATSTRILFFRVFGSIDTDTSSHSSNAPFKARGSELGREFRADFATHLTVSEAINAIHCNRGIPESRKIVQLSPIYYLSKQDLRFE